MSHDELIAECLPMHNDIGLYDTDLVRLVGVVEGEDDFYYVAKPLNGERRGSTVYYSCVGLFSTLKGIYPRYDSLEMIAMLNGIPPEEQFISSKSPNPKEKP